MPALQAMMAGGFNPAEDIQWKALYWPGGPRFQAEGYTDGQVLNVGENIPDENGVETLVASTTATGVTYEASDTVLNSQPSLRNTTQYAPGFTTGSFAGGDLVMPYSIVYVLATPAVNPETWQRILSDTTDVGNYHFAIYDLAGDGLDPRWYFRHSSGGSGNVNTYVSSIDFPVSFGAGYGVRHFVQAASSALFLNGVEAADSAPKGGFDLTGVNLFRIPGVDTGAWQGGTGFIGIYEGDITADPRWSGLQSWILATFNVTV